MNYSAVFGIIVTTAVLLMGILLGSPLVFFCDWTSVYIVLLGTISLTMATHGVAGLGAFRRGLGHILCPAWCSQTAWSSSEYRVVAQVARTGGTAAIMMAACGAMIGLTQMVQNMDDPNEIGPALGVCLLTGFYAIVLNLLIFIPLSRYFTEAAIETEASAHAG